MFKWAVFVVLILTVRLLFRKRLQHFFKLFSMKVRKWISDWNLSTEKKHTLLRLLYDALVDCKKRYVELNKRLENFSSFKLVYSVRFGGEIVFLYTILYCKSFKSHRIHLDVLLLHLKLVFELF